MNLLLFFRLFYWSFSELAYLNPLIYRELIDFEEDCQYNEVSDYRTLVEDFLKIIEFMKYINF